MILFSVGNQIVSSNKQLPGLASIAHGTPHYSFHLHPSRAQKQLSVQWFHHWLDADDAIWALFARLDAGYLVRFPDLADFFIAADTTRIDCYPVAGTPLDTITHLLLDQVLPVVLSRAGHMVVHASAVATPAGAVAFVGSSGRGKSTLASSLALQGFPLVTDDCLLLAEAGSDLMVTPSYPGMRLWEDSIESLFEHAPSLSDVAHYTDKKRLNRENGALRFQRESLPLACMFFLADPAEVPDQQQISIKALSAREVFIELVSYCFKLEIDNRDVLAREFQLLNRVAHLPLFYRLTYRHDFAQLPAVQAAVLEHLHG